MIARLICRLFGHRRGRRISSVLSSIKRFECPRCKATWERKARQKRGQFDEMHAKLEKRA
jgi:hypothetical protein